jgi:surfeit locus 1 family protein
VRASGDFQAAGQIYVDNQVLQERAGYFVVTPLQLRDGAVVLVNRGWIARGPAYPDPPPAPPPAGTVEVTGLATLPPARFLELGPAVSGNVWQKVLPVIVLSDAPGAGLEAVHETPDSGVAKHREYALTWFALAATTLALWVGLNLARAR